MCNAHKYKFNIISSLRHPQTHTNYNHEQSRYEFWIASNRRQPSRSGKRSSIVIGFTRCSQADAISTAVDDGDTEGDGLASFAAGVGVAASPPTGWPDMSRCEPCGPCMPAIGDCAINEPTPRLLLESAEMCGANDAAKAFAVLLVAMLVWLPSSVPSRSPGARMHVCK
jgi:hypothetical protein